MAHLPGARHWQHGDRFFHHTAIGDVGGILKYVGHALITVRGIYPVDGDTVAYVFVSGLPKSKAALHDVVGRDLTAVDGDRRVDANLQLVGLHHIAAARRKKIGEHVADRALRVECEVQHEARAIGYRAVTICGRRYSAGVIYFVPIRVLVYAVCHRAIAQAVARMAEDIQDNPHRVAAPRKAGGRPHLHTVYNACHRRRAV